MSEEYAIQCVPPSLYTFLCLLLVGQEDVEEEESETQEAQRRSRGPSIALNLIYIASGGKNWTPKHISLDSTLHQATRSKHLVSYFIKRDTQ